MIQVSLSRGPKRRGISLSLTPQKQTHPNSQDKSKVNLSAQNTYIQYQPYSCSPVQDFNPSSSGCQPVAAINISTPNTVYYVQSKQNVSFSYSHASQNSKPLSESVMLDRKINELQSQITQKHNMLKQIKNSNQKPSPARKFVEVTQNVTNENKSQVRYQRPIASFNTFNNPVPPIVTHTTKITNTNTNQNENVSKINVPKKKQQFDPITKFQAIQISTMPIVSQQNHINSRSQRHQQSQITIINHQIFESKPPAVQYPSSYKISQREKQEQPKIVPQRSQNFLNAKNTQNQVQKSSQKKEKSATKKKAKAKQQQVSKETRNKDAKQNIKGQKRNIDYNKLRIMESKLLDIIKVCQQGL